MTDIKDVIKKVVSYNKSNPLDSYSLNYQAASSQLEPIYYWILDFMNEKLGFNKIEKITDNFMSSPGSGHFAEMSQRATKMQEEGMKILGGLNQVIKSTLNLIYDLRDFKQRLETYEKAKSSDPLERDAGELALKQIWLDSVDLNKRQSGSIHQMTAQLGYTTLRDAFMVADSLDKIDKMKDEDGLINDTVARVLKPRLQEFFDWKKMSEKELKKRFKIEKSYLKSQVETIKLYSGWMQPYLKAAEELRQQGFDGDAALVSAFSTSMFNLTLMATKKVSSEYEGKQKADMKDYNGRTYYAVALVTFEYRGHLMQRLTQRGDYGPAVEGYVKMNMDAYSVNEEELKLIHDKLEKDRLGDTLTFNSNLAEEALKEIKDDLDEFLNDKEDEEEKKEETKKNEADLNPLSALIGFDFKKKYNKKKKTKEIKEPSDIAKDSWAEKMARREAANKATSLLYALYDVYKKAHGMASSPQPFDQTTKKDPDTELKDLFEKVRK